MTTLDELIQSIMTAKESLLKHCIEANSVTLNGRKYGKLIENLPPNIKPTICGMAVKADYALPDAFDFLVQREPPHPITNADKIRAMTDAELAEWLKSIRYSWTCVPRNNGNRCADFKDDCKACWIDWLEQEDE